MVKLHLMFHSPNYPAACDKLTMGWGYQKNFKSITIKKNFLVLIETMRREGYELQVGKPQVIEKIMNS